VRSPEKNRQAVVTWLTITGIVLLILLALTGCVNRLFIPDGTVIYPEITPVAGDTGTLDPARTFSFEGTPVTLQVPVDAAVYSGAENADRDITIYGNVSESVWVTGAYTHIMDDPAQEPFYRNLTGALRSVRASRSLDDDEYLELMAAFTQSLQYEIRNRTDPKFPVETYVDGSGDCDDKTLLLAGLLSREGYRVALFLFGPESHMAVGIADGTSAYKDTGYAYLETTAPSLVGIPPDSLRGNVTLTSQPVVIPIGNGTKLYTGTDQARYIWATLKKADARVEELEGEIARQQVSLSAEKAALDRENQDLSGLLAKGQYSQYNAGVIRYNSGVAVYNRNLDSFRALNQEYNRMAEIHNYIITHLSDRKGTYQWVLARQP